MPNRSYREVYLDQSELHRLAKNTGLKTERIKRILLGEALSTGKEYGDLIEQVGRVFFGTFITGKAAHARKSGYLPPRPIPRPKPKPVSDSPLNRALKSTNRKYRVCHPVFVDPDVADKFFMVVGVDEPSGRVVLELNHQVVGSGLTRQIEYDKLLARNKQLVTRKHRRGKRHVEAYGKLKSLQKRK